MKKITVIVCLLLLFGFGSAAQATLINGSIFFTGLGTLNAPSATATALNFSSATVGAVTGDYVATPSLVGQSAGFNSFTFSPFVPPQVLWSFTSNSITYSFDISTLTIAQQDSDTVVLKGQGFANITNFDPTPGIWQISTSSVPGSLLFTFSSSASVVPEPSTLLLLGLGILSLAGLRMRSTK